MKIIYFLSCFINSFSLIISRCRASIKLVEPSLTVKFIDFGNDDVVKPEDIKTLPSSLKAIAPLVKIHFE